ncbi:MAG TPA: hypothetical protein VIL34_22005 [Actinopolymorphaceae bacterium]
MTRKDGTDKGHPVQADAAREDAPRRETHHLTGGFAMGGPAA